MNNDAEQLRRLLAKIAKLAAAAGDEMPTGDERVAGDGSAAGTGAEVPGCIIKSLPQRLLHKAAKNATSHNPLNAPGLPAGGGADFGVMDPLQLAVMTKKYWGPSPRRLTVSFLETAPADLRRKILGHMNAWTRTGCISFVETARGGQVRITRNQEGYWSYLGTDILLIPQNRPTMCLQGFSMSMPDSEFYRVVRHETGHTLGFPHEHMRKELIARLDRKKTYEYFWEHYRWPKEVVDAQVLTPLDDASIMATPPDEDSIMCYQLPGDITKDGNPIRGGTDINSTDYAFNGRLYPKPGTTPAAELVGVAAAAAEGEWSEEEDVEVGE